MSTASANGPLPAVVLGGGLAGLAAARLLARHYPRVVVHERVLSGESLPTWYVYREGNWIPSD